MPQRYEKVAEIKSHFDSPEREQNGNCPATKSQAIAKKKKKKKDSVAANNNALLMQGDASITSSRCSCGLARSCFRLSPAVVLMTRPLGGLGWGLPVACISCLVGLLNQIWDVSSASPTKTGGLLGWYLYLYLYLEGDHAHRPRVMPI